MSSADAAGIPAASAAPEAAQARPARRLGPLGLVVLVLVTGVLVTLLTWQVNRSLAQQTETRRFDYRTSRILGELRQGITSDEVRLRSLAAVFGMGGGAASPARWRDYFDAIGSGARAPGRQWLAFAQRVPTAQRLDAFPLYVHASGSPGPRPLGLDLQQDPLARDAMARAHPAGAIVLTGLLALSSPQVEGGRVWALLVPAYADAAAPSSTSVLIGYLIEALDVKQLLETAIGPDASMIGVRVRDGGLPVFTSAELLQPAAGEADGLRRVAQLDFGQRRWDLEFVALPRFAAGAGADPGWGILAIGFVITVLVAGLLGALATLRVRALSLVDERTGALRSALQGYAASEARLRAVFDHALDAFVTIDPKGIVQSFNPAAERMFGWQASEVIGRNVSMLMPSPDHERHDGYLRNYLAGGPPRIIGIGRLVTGRRKDGSELPLELGVSEMTVAGQRLFSGIMRDVTERLANEKALRDERELLEGRVLERTSVLTRTNAALQEEINERRRVEGELVAAREQALQAAEAKASFLANMSHEIRTPMNAVVGMTALLEDTGLDAEQRSYVQTIHTSGDALLSIINDILDFSKSESGMLQLEQRAFELGLCVEEAFDILAPRAADKGIDLLYEIMDNVPHSVVGDQARLRQVLVNLLSNAVKFTDSGEVCLTVSVLRRGPQDAHLRFAVRDTGIGIAPAQQDKLFKAFSQGDASTTRKYGGTGLGLAISARLVRLMGGDIHVESEERKGSTFSFTIAAGIAANVPTAQYRAHGMPELAGRKVLLVDDNPTNLQILQTQCRRWGMEVACAARGTLALALLEAEGPFDVAVLDLHIPSMDGLQLARAIAAQLGDAAPPLVLLSSAPARGRDFDALKLFAATLAKPVKHSRLFAVLDEVIHQRQAAPSPSPAPAIDAALAGRLPMAILVVEDSDINRKLAVTMLRKFGYACDTAADGAEAVEKTRVADYDLVFMDLQMPVMDGLEATRRILALPPRARRPRIVAMTANALPADRQRCLDAGMDDYLAKPILPATVQALIERWAPQRAHGPAEAAEGLLDEPVLKELSALEEPGRPSVLRGLVADYLDETPAALVALKQDLQAGDPAAVGRRAHKLAGTSASLGVKAVAEVCYRIEQAVQREQSASLPALVEELEMRFSRTRTPLQRYAGA